MRAHLIARQTLKREGHGELVDDERTWVPACGGIVGVGGHHGLFDGYRLVVPREALPEALEALCAEIGLEHWLTRRYGERRPT